METISRIQVGIDLVAISIDVVVRLGSAEYLELRPRRWVVDIGQPGQKPNTEKRFELGLRLLLAGV